MFALFVGDLYREVSDLMLLNRFVPAGPIHSVHICRDRKTGLSLGYAYINFYNRDDAERAINMFNFELLLGRPMRVKWSRWEPTAKTVVGGNIIIKNLDQTINDVALFDTFSVFGRIVSCKVVNSKSCGYIQFQAAEAAAKAIQRLNGMLLNNCQVTIEFFKSQEEQHMAEHKVTARGLAVGENPGFKNEGNNLYINNLDYAINTECLYMAFAQFGIITSAKVIMENGRSRGFGFVRFRSSHDAMRAMQTMNCMMWGRKQVNVRLAQRRKEQQAQNLQMFNQQFNTTPELHQPVLPSGFNTSSPAVETPHSEDIVHTVEASASEDTVPIAAETAAPKGITEAVESSAPLDAVETVESAAPLDTVETVESAAPLYIVEAVKTAAPKNSVDIVESAAPEETVDTVESAAPEETVVIVESAAPEETVAIVESAAPEETVAIVESAAPEETVERTPAIPEETQKMVNKNHKKKRGRKKKRNL